MPAMISVCTEADLSNVAAHWPVQPIAMIAPPLPYVRLKNGNALVQAGRPPLGASRRDLPGSIGESFG